MEYFHSPIVRQYAIVILANFTTFSVALGLAWTSPILPKLRDKNNPVLGIPITDRETSWIVSTPFLSTLLAGSIAAFLVKRIGRKNCIIISSVPRILCYILMLCATNTWMIVFARFLSGCADGFSYVGIPSYVSEISSVDMRGRLGTLMQIFTNLGLLVIFAVGPYLSYMALNLTILIICILVTILLIFIPDSPYSLFSRGKKSECKKLLLKLRGTNEKANEELMDLIQLHSEDNKISLKEVLKTRVVIKSLIIVSIMGFLCNWIGHLAVQEYLQTILASTGSNLQPELSSVIVGIIQFISGMFAAFITDKFNRKPIIFVSLCTIATGMVGLGAYFWRYDAGYEMSSFLNVLPLISMILVFIGYNGGVGCVIINFAAEMFDGSTRGIGIGSAILSSSAAAFTITWFMYPLIHSIGASWTFCLYGCVGVLLALFIAFAVPETKGRSFNEIQVALGRKILETVDDVEHSKRNKYVFK